MAAAMGRSSTQARIIAPVIDFSQKNHRATPAANAKTIKAIRYAGYVTPKRPTPPLRNSGGRSLRGVPPKTCRAPLDKMKAIPNVSRTLVKVLPKSTLVKDCCSTSPSAPAVSAPTARPIPKLPVASIATRPA